MDIRSISLSKTNLTYFFAFAVLGAAAATGTGGAATKPAVARSPIHTVMEEDANGDYRVYLFGGRALVCEEQPVTVIAQPDAVSPLVVECRHDATGAAGGEDEQRKGGTR